jgi:hypothetical protein
MSESLDADRGLVSILDLPGLTQQEEQTCAPQVMPLELNAREAECFENALGFLFVLISLYDEMIEHSVPAGPGEA